MSKLFTLLALAMLVAGCSDCRPSLPSNFILDAKQLGREFFITGTVESISWVDRVERGGFWGTGTSTKAKSIRLRTPNAVYSFESALGSSDPNFNSIGVGDCVRLNITDNDFYIGGYRTNECAIVPCP